MTEPVETAAPRRRRRRWPWLLLALLLLAGGTGLALQQTWLRIPANLVPWEPVQLEAAPGWLARYRINGLAADAPACFAALDGSELEYARVPERPVQNGCGLVNTVRIGKSHIPYGGSFTITCPMAAALYWFERDLQAAARAELGTEVARIEHFGSYACRNVNNRQTGRRSQHATANALDVSGFRLKDGRLVSVLKHWDNGAAEGRFLAAAQGAACRYFNTVLGPDYNAAHANHFHLDLGRARICR